MSIELIVVLATIGCGVLIVTCAYFAAISLSPARQDRFMKFLADVRQALERR